MQRKLIIKRYGIELSEVKICADEVVLYIKKHM